MADRIADVLAELGAKSSDEIVALFRGLGVRGVPRQSRSCPVARYLSNATGEICLVGTDTAESIRLDAKRNDLPDSVQVFVSAFDEGRYPDLVEPRP